MSLDIEYSIDINDLNICPDDILNIIYKYQLRPDDTIINEILEIYNELNNIAEIKGGYVIYDEIEIISKNGLIKIRDLYFEIGEKICSFLNDVRRIAVFICTAGHGFSVHSNKHNKDGDYLRGYLIDTYGSLIVEKAINYIQNQLELNMKILNMKITNRYSPGYCGWPLDNQKKIFSLLPKGMTIVSLSENYLMIPIKSVSGIIGIGDCVQKFDHSCKNCMSDKCKYSNIKSL